MPPAARITDMHTCPMVNPGPVPHVGGPIIAGEPTVLVGFMPAARIGDQATCVGPPDVIAKGSPTVLIGYMPAARLGDSTAHGGVIVVGCFTVMIGDSGGGGGGGGGGGAGGGGGGGGGGEQAPESSDSTSPAPSGSTVTPAAISAQAKDAAGNAAAVCEVCPKPPTARRSQPTQEAPAHDGPSQQETLKDDQSPGSAPAGNESGPPEP